eukprot:789524-Pyramimonas_sp.AAC.1
MDGQPTESEETPTPWIPIRAGAGSREHAFETLCWLATGQGPLPEAHWDGGTFGSVHADGATEDGTAVGGDVRYGGGTGGRQCATVDAGSTAQ